MTSWQEVVLYLGGLIALLTTIAAFVFQYLRKDDAVLVLKKDLDLVQGQIQSIKETLREVDTRASASDMRLEAKVEKLIELFIQLRQNAARS